VRVQVNAGLARPLAPAYAEVLPSNLWDTLELLEDSDGSGGDDAASSHREFALVNVPW
jgi:hypothetical protein